MKLTSILFSLLIFLPGITIAQERAAIQAHVDKFAALNSFAGANISLSVFDIADDEEIAAFNGKNVLTPASSLKLVSSFAGLEYLGSDYTYTSTLYYNGKISRDGTLDGDVVFEGSGDPTLGSGKIIGSLNFNDLLETSAQKIIDAGITCIDGDLVCDESVFNSFPICPTWQWNDLGNYYACGAWGINVHENLYYVNFSNRKKVGNLTRIKNTAPFIPNLKLSNEVSVDSANTGDNAYIFGGPYNYYKRIIGTIPAGDGTFTIKGSIPDPPLFLAFHLMKTLSTQNIQTQSYRTQFRNDKSDKRRIMIHKFTSPPLSDIIKKANFDSNNLYSEAIIKTVGLKYNGLGSGQNGIAAIKKMLRKYKVDFKGMRLHDGCGLSVRNQISSHTLASFLSKFSKDRTIEALSSYLPRGGYEGTVRSMFKNHPCRGYVYLKSGSMESIQSYTGYIKSKSGKWLSFSILVNGYSNSGYSARKNMEKLISDIYASY